MSANSYITSVPLFQGAQGSYYLVNGYKYHPCFPVHWAMNHKTFYHGKHEARSGPIDCPNCAAYGSIKGVFVGYCSNCLRNYLDVGIWRGVLVARGMDINDLQNLTIWMQYPYMYGIDKNEIGDKPITTDDCNKCESEVSDVSEDEQ